MRRIGTQWRELSFEKKLGIVVVPVLLAVLSGLVIPLLSQQAASIGEDDPPPPASQLQVVDLAVSGGESGECLKDKPVPQRVDVTVRNVGELVTVVKRIAFRVRAFGLLTIPEGGGGLEASEDYEVLLPPDPKVGQIVNFKVSQELRPNTADRFTIRVDVPEPARQVGARLFQLDVLLYHDTGSDGLNAGTVLVAAPYLPSKNYFRAGNPWVREQPDASPVRTMVENEKTYGRMMALPGERAPGLTTEILNASGQGDSGPDNPCRPRIDTSPSSDS